MAAIMAPLFCQCGLAYIVAQYNRGVVQQTRSQIGEAFGIPGQKQQTIYSPISLLYSFPIHFLETDTVKIIAIGLVIIPELNYWPGLKNTRPLIPEKVKG